MFVTDMVARAIFGRRDCEGASEGQTVTLMPPTTVIVLQEQTIRPPFQAP